MKLYGIKNCDTVKKARKFLDEANVPYEFHDYKKDGVDEVALREFVAEFGWDTVLNKRGTSWRKLPDDVKDEVTDAETAMSVMFDNPSTIKRPLVQSGEHRLIGFDAVAWEMALEMGQLK
ncbi:ArsC family reductase [Roseibium sp. CAU 1637]|uniref:ArsC family reductase n=1 Tax=Roseibium limicola TaxID=2816037 RepID=A0A939ERJ5_9HYPH|nr:ArsC family reductase [Roseibium limicola]MBO0347262.1 ArsC family reductase [Roseibium limicola]